MSNIIPFNFNQHHVRVIDHDGEPWFFAQDVAEVLDYSATGAMNKLIAEEDRQIQTFHYGTTYIKQTLINEAGLYTAIFNSTKPEAKRFKRWVTQEVLPAIRKTGSYQAGPAAQDVKPLIEANRLFRSNLSIARLVFKGNQALLSANMATRKAAAIDVLGNIGATHLLAETREALLTASDIGRQIGLSGRKINLLFEAKGLLKSIRDHKNRKQYELTEHGAQFGEYLDTTKRRSDGTPVKQIKWYSRIVELLEDWEPDMIAGKAH